jgi:hypothetical protein
MGGKRQGPVRAAAAFHEPAVGGGIGLAGRDIKTAHHQLGSRALAGGAGIEVE